MEKWNKNRWWGIIDGILHFVDCVILLFQPRYRLKRMKVAHSKPSFFHFAPANYIYFYTWVWSEITLRCVFMLVAIVKFNQFTMLYCALSFQCVCMRNILCWQKSSFSCSVSNHGLKTKSLENCMSEKFSFCHLFFNYISRAII